jgi:arylsulfatase A-like enzyme
VKDPRNKTHKEFSAGGTELRCTLSQFVSIACFTSLFAGLFDVIVVLLLKPDELSSSIVSLNIAAVAALVLVTYLFLWLAVAYPVGRALRLSTLPLAISLSVFLVLFCAALSMSEIIPPSWSRHDLARLFILAAGSLVVSIGAYVTASETALSTKYRQVVEVVGCSTPYILAEFGLFAWLMRARIGLFPSIQFLLVFLAFGGLAIATIIAVRRVASGGGTTLLMGSLLAAVLVLPLHVLVGLNSPSGPSRSEVRAGLPVRHVILITIDTLRADFLSCLNPGAPTTPNIDTLARDGVLFKRAVSSAPWTLPSVSSIMTGLSPLVHQTMYPRSRLPDELTTLAEYMQEAGYYTAAIGYNPFLMSSYNVCQGFDEYTFTGIPVRHSSLGGFVVDSIFPWLFPSTGSTGQITNLVTRWMERNKDRRFFLWTHYLDPHVPYSPPPAFIPDGEPSPRIGTTFHRADDIRAGHLFPTPTERRWIRALYGGEVRYVDDNVGQVLQALKRLGIYDDALILLTSDHGEEFWEHGGFEHGHSLNQELLWVPLIVKLPRSVRQGEVAARVSTESILPTVLDICDVDYEDQYLTGRSLIALIDGRAQSGEATPLLSTGTLYYEQQESVAFGEYKYVLHAVTGDEEFFRLDSASGYEAMQATEEQLERARTILDLRRSACAELREYYGVIPEEAPIDESVQEQLRALGYVK